MIATSLQQTLAKEKLNYHPKQAICVLFHPREDKQQDFFFKKKSQIGYQQPFKSMKLTTDNLFPIKRTFF